jgi:hypothetical protein
MCQHVARSAPEYLHTLVIVVQTLGKSKYNPTDIVTASCTLMMQSNEKIYQLESVAVVSWKVS